jgi:NTE family protein
MKTESSRYLYRISKAKPPATLRGILHESVGCVLTLLLVGGCASHGVVENQAITRLEAGQGYSLLSYAQENPSGDIRVLLTFSGGGTRAAAMAYGVLRELRDTQVVIEGRTTRLLDEVDQISSVSGGSFTAAYYGLHGDGLFQSFEEDFLRFDLEKHLVRRLFNPVRWFSSKGRTEMAVQYYQKVLFHNATFADMQHPGQPLIIINASDLAFGVRFSFLQEYFNLLCSDLASFPVARAVAASSAVPVMFNPVVVANHPGCGADEEPAWLLNARERSRDDAELDMLASGLASYRDKDTRKFIHLVDGGITDNMGLRTMYDVIEIAGGAETFLQRTNQTPPRRMVIISVNAAIDPVIEMDKSTRQPSILEALDALSGVQIRRYNAATLALVKNKLDDWSQQVSTPERPVTPYLIQIGFKDVVQPQLRLFFNKIPTNFSLTDEQVDKLIETAGELLRNNPDFQQLLSDIKSP